MNSLLKPEQVEVVLKCIEKKKGGLSLPMGFGKTLIAIETALNITKDKILIVVSKTLVSSWIFEIGKFYKDLEYEVLLSINENYKGTNKQIIITTPEVLVKCYKSTNLAQLFVTSRKVNINNYLQTDISDYNIKTVPYFNLNHGLIYILKNLDATSLTKFKIIQKLQLKDVKHCVLCVPIIDFYYQEQCLMNPL